MRIVVLGAPGSGKGTQAALLAERLGVPTISTGEMLRQAVEQASPLGERVAAVIAAGELVDDPTMREVVADRLQRGDASRGFLLDGYPRTVAQARDLEEILGGPDALAAVVLIQVPIEEMVRRAVARGREDDAEEVVRRRHRVYDEQTRPLIGYYEGRGLLRPVDGDQSVEAVYDEILDVLGVKIDGTANAG